MALERAVLDALSRDIDEHPEVLQPVGIALVERMRCLVAGVDVDREQPLHQNLMTRAYLERRAWLRRRTAWSWGHLFKRKRGGR